MGSLGLAWVLAAGSATHFCLCIHVFLVSSATARSKTSLGQITVKVNKTTAFHPAPTPELVNDRLRENAAAMGADAVVLVRYGDVGISMMSWGSLEGKGRAVKFLP
ncbi:hypothetical protein [Acidovorax sp.]|uniref:hypothetical protein n=1 Tax=Acidovorax sp. TaxID=1872122 RepID=UPI00391F99D6